MKLIGLLISCLFSVNSWGACDPCVCGYGGGELPPECSGRMPRYQIFNEQELIWGPNRRNPQSIAAAQARVLQSAQQKCFPKTAQQWSQWKVIEGGVEERGAGAVLVQAYFRCL